MMSKNEVLETQMTGPLAAALIIVATLSLTVMGLANIPGQSYVDEIFGALGLAALVSAARIIDATLDKAALDSADRFKLIGGGYFLFCLIVGAIGFAILLVYATKSTGLTLPWITLPPALIMWACLTGMLMSRRGNEAWLVGAVIAFVLFILVRPVP
jgi:hypothetical protein